MQRVCGVQHVNKTRLSATTIDLLCSAEIRYGQQTGSTLFASLDTSSYKLRTTARQRSNRHYLKERQNILSKFSKSIWVEQACIIQAVFLDSDQKIQESHIRTVSKTKVLSSPTHLLQFGVANSSVHARVRCPDELATYILSSTSPRTPLITLWMASWCPSCSI